MSGAATAAIGSKLGHKLPDIKRRAEHVLDNVTAQPAQRAVRAVR
jgi:hypothetical protein